MHVVREGVTGECICCVRSEVVLAAACGSFMLFNVGVHFGVTWEGTSA